MSTGYPDYGRFSAVSGNEVVSTTVTQAGFISGLLNVAPYSTLIFSADLTNTTGVYLISLAWFTDSTGGTEIAQSSITLLSGGRNTFKWPTVTAWLRIEVTQIPGGITESFPLAVYGSTSSYDNVASLRDAAPLIIFSGSVGAGTTYTTGTAPLAIGAATLSVHHASNASWNGSLDYWDQASAAYVTFLQWDGSTYGNDHTSRISLPPAPVRMRLTNSDTSSRTMIGSLTLD